MAQNKRALLVGISDYQCVNKYGGWNNIHGKNDIDMLYPTLKKCGASVSCLYNKGATKTGITKALNVLISQCKKGDIVYLHFSTHGQPFEDESGDEDDGWDESIVPVDAPIEYTKGKYEGENHLIDDELHNYCSRIRKVIGKDGMLYVVIDACHAGRLLWVSRMRLSEVQRPVFHVAANIIVLRKLRRVTTITFHHPQNSERWFL